MDAQRAEYSPFSLLSAMIKRPIAICVLAATLTIGCAPVPHWNLDEGIKPFSTPSVVEHLVAGLQRLGARTDVGRLLIADAQQAYCTRTATAIVPAVTTGWNIHICETWWQLPPEKQRVVVWHELELEAVHQ